MDFNYQACDFSVKAIFAYNPNAKPFNPKPSESDIQSAKIIFYYPASFVQDEKNNQVGLTEGIFQFVNSFAQEETPIQLPRFQTIHLVSQIYVIGQYEEDVYIFMALKRMKTETLNDFYYEQVTKSTITKVLNNYVQHFNIWFDGFNQDKENLSKQLTQFTPLWMSCFNLNFTYFQVYQFRYAPLDGQLFLTLQFLTSMIFQLDSTLQEIIIFYNGFFIYSSLPHKISVYFKQHYYDTGALWGLNEQKINQKFRQGISGSNAFMVFNNMKSMSTGAQQVRLPQEGSNQYIKYDYFTLLERNLLVLLFYKHTESPQWNKIKEVSTALQTNIERITTKLDIFMEQTNQKNEQLRYMYFNEMNLAYKMPLSMQLSKITNDNLKIMLEMHEKLTKCRDSRKQIIRYGGIWFVGLRICERCLILIFPGQITMSKLEEEVNKSLESSFSGLFL